MVEDAAVVVDAEAAAVVAGAVEIGSPSAACAAAGAAARIVTAAAKAQISVLLCFFIISLLWLREPAAFVGSGDRDKSIYDYISILAQSQRNRTKFANILHLRGFSDRTWLYIIIIQWLNANVNGRYRQNGSIEKCLSKLRQKGRQCSEWFDRNALSMRRAA